MRIKGITKDAQLLGVSRAHLWEVLTGRRVSTILSSDYKNLKAAQCAGKQIQPQSKRHKRAKRSRLVCSLCHSKVINHQPLITMKKMRKSTLIHRSNQAFEWAFMDLCAGGVRNYEFYLGQGVAFYLAARGNASMNPDFFNAVTECLPI